MIVESVCVELDGDVIIVLILRIENLWEAFPRSGIYCRVLANLFIIFIWYIDSPVNPCCFSISDSLLKFQKAFLRLYILQYLCE